MRSSLMVSRVHLWRDGQVRPARKFLAAPLPRRCPSPAVVSHLRTAIEQRDVDIVHGYEWPPILEAELAQSGTRARATGTVLSMSVTHPRWASRAVGTEQIAAHERLAGRRRVRVIEPPVDLMFDDPALVDGAQWRHDLGIEPDAVIAVVSRLAHGLQLEGILTAVHVVEGVLGDRLRLVIVGDGPARDRVASAAAGVNNRRGREAVLLTGNLEDPRPAYAGADVFLGMGGSGSWAMAFGKPVVVQGENGFGKRRTSGPRPGSCGRGGTATGMASRTGPAAWSERCAKWDASKEVRGDVEPSGRRLVDHRFALSVMAERQQAIYDEIMRHPGTATVLDTGRSVAGWVHYQAYRRIRRALGRAATDDFNASPVRTHRTNNGVLDHIGRFADLGARRPDLPVGVGRDAVKGTDRRLVEEITRHRPVVWVDPPLSVLRRLRTGTRRRRPANRVHDCCGCTRPCCWVTRPLVRQLAQRWTRYRALRAAAAWGRDVGAVVVASPYQLRHLRSACRSRTTRPTTSLPVPSCSESRVIFLIQQRRLNLERADVVLGITEDLAYRWGSRAASLGTHSRTGAPTPSRSRRRGRSRSPCRRPEQASSGRSTTGSTSRCSRGSPTRVEVWCW